MRQPATPADPAPGNASVPPRGGPRFPVWLAAGLLALATLALYWPAMRCDFVSFDDPDYVTANVHVQSGLTWQTVKWAFGSFVSCNWHPLTMLSHALDCQVFGLKPWGHHLISVLLHAANTALVFIVFCRMTGAAWRSLFLAALFGWHPLHVESVAWIAERKDVLSTFFGLLAIFFYVRYAQSKVHSHLSAECGVRSAEWSCKVERPQSTVGSRRSTIGNYSLALLFFILGLMSKPMLVTLPCVLLLLDYWPLKRIANYELRIANLKPLLLEKIPFFFLAAAASVVAVLVQKQGGALVNVATIPLGARLENALISYCRYLGKMCWPTDLVLFYPHPGYWPLAGVLAAGGFLCVISALVFLARRQYPFLLMGWLWFVGTLVPVIGLVQVGGQSMADRYTYIPSLGVQILAIWGGYELVRRRRYRVIALAAAGSVALIFCLGLTRQQLGYWTDSITLYRHTLPLTKNNYVIHKVLGDALVKNGQNDEALEQYEEAARLEPNDAEAQYNVGVILLNQGRTDEAIGRFREAIRLKPDLDPAQVKLGVALVNQGRIDEAIGRFQEAVRLKPDDADAHIKLGAALSQTGRTGEAMDQYQGALRLAPTNAEAHYNLGVLYFSEGQSDSAMSQYQEAVRLNPDYTDAHYNLGIALFNHGRIREAIEQFQAVVRLKPDDADARINLGDALFKNGQADAAITQFQEALRLKPDDAVAQGNLAKALELKQKPSAQPPDSGQP